jgi:hypothetical protein
MAQGIRRLPPIVDRRWLRRDEFGVGVQTFAGLASLNWAGIGSLPARSAERLNCRDFLAIGRTAANTPMT